MKYHQLGIAALGIARAMDSLPLEVDKRYLVNRDGIDYTVFEHAATGAKMEYVKDSGICETTPGVHQYSGYLSVGNDMNMFFWLFEARQNPTTAPLAAWFNGGPGCSSMNGLFAENGPCHFINNSSTPSLNPYSWNSFANMLYVDQPIGVGFSYGNNEVNSTLTAAPFVWNLIQAFYANFHQYQNRDFGIFTESYGGHYGPEFAHFFEQQNSKIDSGALNATKIPLVALGVNDGWYDPAIQYKSYIDYSYENPYYQIIPTKKMYEHYIGIYNKTCLPELQQSCSHLSGNNSACGKADGDCGGDIEAAIYTGNFSTYDIREPFDNPYPPSTFITYLQQSHIQHAIGAKTNFSSCSNLIVNFSSTADNGRSLLPALGELVSSGMQVALIAGDADWICNYKGGFGVANAIDWAGKSVFSSKKLSSYTVNGNHSGLFKSHENLSWLQVFESGHEVPFYQPQAALQYFIQTMSKKPLSST